MPVSARELLVLGDQAGETALERRRPGLGAFAAHRAVVCDRAGDVEGTAIQLTSAEVGETILLAMAESVEPAQPA